MAADQTGSLLPRSTRQGARLVGELGPNLRSSSTPDGSTATRLALPVEKDDDRAAGEFTSVGWVGATAVWTR
jgi:hypothetical protein